MIPSGFLNDYHKAVKKGKAPDYGEPIDIQAVNGRFGVGIVLEFTDGKYLSPYFNQMPDEPKGFYDDDTPVETEREELELDSDSYIESMADATDWSEGEWFDTHPSVM